MFHTTANKIQKGVFTGNAQLPSFSKVLIARAVSRGLATAMVVYAFAYMVSEVFQFIPASLGALEILANDQERTFFNRFYAYLALISGQNVCLSILLSSLKRHQPKFKGHLFRGAKHDQTNLLIFTLYVVTAFGVDNAFVFGHGLFSSLGFYDQHRYITWILLVVLFLHSWTFILRIYRKQVLKYMLYSALAIAFMGFGLGKVEMLPIEKMKHAARQSDPVYKYQPELPNSKYSAPIDWDNKIVKRLYLIPNADSVPAGDWKLYRGVDYQHKLSLLNNLIRGQYECYQEGAIQDITWMLIADKNTPYSVIHEYISNMNLAGITQFYWAVDPVNEGVAFVSDIKSCMLSYNTGSATLMEDTEELVLFVSDGIASINGLVYSDEGYKQALYDRLIHNAGHVKISLDMGHSSTYQDYINLCCDLNEVMYSVYNTHGKRLFNKKFEELDEQEHGLLRSKINISY